MGHALVLRRIPSLRKTDVEGRLCLQVRALAVKAFWGEAVPAAATPGNARTCPWRNELDLLELAYVDDWVLTVISNTPGKLGRAIQKTMKAVRGACAADGMAVNYLQTRKD